MWTPVWLTQPHFSQNAICCGEEFKAADEPGGADGRTSSPAGYVAKNNLEIWKKTLL